MTFLIPCPNCGAREATEFTFGGESKRRPAPGAPTEELSRYLFMRVNVNGLQTEWWYHRDGCRRWFLGIRHTMTNEFERTFWPGERDAVRA